MNLAAFEHEFLIRLAPIWLACRYKIMGHQLRNWSHKSDLAFDLLGCHDYAHEMRLLCEEAHDELQLQHEYLEDMAALEQSA